VRINLYYIQPVAHEGNLPSKTNPLSTGGRDSGLELECESDVLPVLSDTALLSLRATEVRYLAGLWQKDMQSGRSYSVLQCQERPAEYFAPIWSWRMCDVQPGPTMLWVRTRTSAGSTIAHRVEKADIVGKGNIRLTV